MTKKSETEVNNDRAFVKFANKQPVGYKMKESIDLSDYEEHIIPLLKNLTGASKITIETNGCGAEGCYYLEPKITIWREETPAERHDRIKKMFDMEQRFDAMEKQRKAQQEEEDRAEYVRLKRKFEGTPELNIVNKTK